MATGGDKLSQLIDKAAAGDFDSDVIEWLATAFKDYQRGRGTLEDCLGLSPQARRREATRLLQEAAGCLRTEGQSDWLVANLLKARIRRLESGRVKTLTEADEKILQAIATGARFPRCRKRLYDLVRNGQ